MIISVAAYRDGNDPIAVVVVRLLPKEIRIRRRTPTPSRMSVGDDIAPTATTCHAVI